MAHTDGTKMAARPASMLCVATVAALMLLALPTSGLESSIVETGKLQKDVASQTLFSAASG